MRFRGSPWPAAERTYPQHDKFMRGWEVFMAQNPDGLITDDRCLPKCGELFASLDPIALRRLILRMMHPVPEKRISIADALNDRWVKAIECCGRDEDDGADANRTTIDATDRRSCKRNAKCGFRKMHNHLPPPPKRTLLHPLEG